MRGCTYPNAKNARKGKKRADSLCGQVDSQLDICRLISIRFNGLPTLNVFNCRCSRISER
uniref:Uncharacterized protein n=1 Tax=Meloidogyne enterolobii TaxID=390850 RepID=A0A6V7URA3_MELEN|nr:unnamed protein product [Meloidogyne enterolobii]